MNEPKNTGHLVAEALAILAGVKVDVVELLNDIRKANPRRGLCQPLDGELQELRERGRRET